jgi:predicted permease
METIWQDARYGLRMLKRSPGFTAIAVLILALGIGANTAIFSVVNALALRPLPVERPGELVAIYSSDASGADYGTTSYPDFLDWRSQNRSFEDLAAWAEIPLSLAAGSENKRVVGQIVSGNYFDLLGVRAALGRTFAADEDRSPGTHAVVVVSDALWRGHFGKDVGLLGRNITLNGHPFTVIGVAPPEFSGISIGAPPLVWVPMMMARVARPRSFDLLGHRGARWMSVFGRLKAGAHLESARGELSGVAKALSETYPRLNSGYDGVAMFPISQARMWPGRQQLAFDFLAMLMSVTGLVLLIACANVATLLLARAASRQKETAIRLSLGATRGRLLRLLLTESAMLSAAAGMAGCFLAMWLTDLLFALRPPEFRILEVNLAPDLRVFGFALALCLFTAILFGLAPAWQVTRPAIATTLKEETPGGGMRSGLRNALVVAQVALSLVLLIAAGLFLRSLDNAREIAIGFEPDNVLLASVDLRLHNYQPVRGNQFYADLLERVRALPGVEAASLTESVPLSQFGWSRRTVHAVGREIPKGEETELAISAIAPDFFRTMRIPVLRGREFTAQDGPDAPRVVIVNETLASRFWPRQDPLGNELRYGVPQEPGQEPPMTVVGVVGNAKYRALGESPRPFYYVPVAQEFEGVMSLVVRARDGAVALAPAIRKHVQTLDPSLPIFNVGSLREAIGSAYFLAETLATLLGIFGGLAVALASVGLYGVMSWAVTQRTRELGIRMALGAPHAHLWWLVIGKGMRLVGVGLLLGAAGALGATRVLANLLYGVSPTDTITFAAMALLLALAALAACSVPARRAARVDPIVALRYE